MADDKLTKIDLVESVYLNTKIEKQDVQKVIDNLLEQLKSSMSDGKTIELRGFGTFEKRLRKGRAKARNPKTGEIVSVEPMTSLSKIQLTEYIYCFFILIGLKYKYIFGSTRFLWKVERETLQC